MYKYINHMKFLILAIFFSISLFAQEHTIYGKVVDNNNNAIPNVVIEAKETYEGISCDTDGIFYFTVNSDSVNTLVFSCLGYIEKELSTKKILTDTIIVVLQKGYSVLDDVVIKDKRKKNKKGTLGKKKLKYNGGSYQVWGNEMAIYLGANPDRQGILDQVFIYITNEGIPGDKFRLHIYDKDSVNFFPQYDISGSEIIMHADTGNEWISVDLSQRRIPIKDGIFISMEWIPDHGNNEEKWYQKKLAEYYNAGSRDNYFNGPVLGMTWSYGVQSRTFTSEKNSHDEWEYIRPIGKRRGPIRVSHWINPMIYATYTYTKK